MGTYEKNQIKMILDNSREGYYKIKIAGSDDSTNWMNITKSQLKKIQKALTR